jgi:hypothetical protein
MNEKEARSVDIEFRYDGAGLWMKVVRLPAFPRVGDEVSFHDPEMTCSITLKLADGINFDASGRDHPWTYFQEDEVSDLDGRETPELALEACGFSRYIRPGASLR